MEKSHIVTIGDSSGAGEEGEAAVTINISLVGSF